MKTLVIHPKDSTTDFLSEIYSDKDWTVLTTNPSHSKLQQLIHQHDRIVMLGHGSAEGLFGFKRVVVSSKLVYLLRQKKCVSIWCYADWFVKTYDLKGFYTGMIISELDEAIDHCVQANSAEISQSNALFADAIKKSIDSDDIVNNVKAIYDGDSPIINFNRMNIFER